MAEGPMTPPQHRELRVPGAPERPRRQDRENVANYYLQNLNLNNGDVARRLDFGNGGNANNRG
jgi:hypothetical protein